MVRSSVKILFVLLATVIFLMNTEKAIADQEVSDEDYSITTANNEYIWVMFISDEKIESRIKALNDPSLPGDLDKSYVSPNYKSILDFLERDGFGTDKALRSQYPCSGLYKNDGSDTPIWTVNWYAQWIFIHPDGEYLVRMGRWPRLETDYEGHRYFGELAVAFYRNGNEIVAYSVQDLVHNPELLPVSKSHYEWRKTVSFDEMSGILKIDTLTGESYEFDVIEMLPENSDKVVDCKPNALYAHLHGMDPFTIPPLLLVLPIIGVVVILLVFRKIKRKPINSCDDINRL